jgi:serine protease inhibitor
MVMKRSVAPALVCLLLVTTACGGAQQPSASATLPSAGSLHPSTSSAPATALPATAAPTPVPSYPGGMQLAAADVERAPVTADDAAAAAAGINAFGLELYRLLTADNDNLVFSPSSIALALGMARAGARGTTAAEMDAVLHGVASDDHAAWLNALDQALADRNGTFGNAKFDQVPLTLRIANTSFFQQGEPIEQAYLDALASRFGSGARLVDFIGHTEEARQLINGWVDEQTTHRIPELLSPGVLTNLTRFVLVNAIYLKAGWRYPFEADLTTQKPFTLTDGLRVKVPMMAETAPLLYAAGSGWQAVQLPYAGQLAMTIILPDDLASFEATLDGARLSEIVNGLSSRPVILTVPKFGVETKANLADLLKALGMPTAFTGAADFSGIAPPAGALYIGDVIHQANIDVDEKGTEAAAATAIEGIGSAGGADETPPPPVVVNVDHPFIFAVRDVPTGAVLFLGRVVDPSAAS